MTRLILDPLYFPKVETPPVLVLSKTVFLTRHYGCQERDTITFIVTILFVVHLKLRSGGRKTSLWYGENHLLT